MRACSSPASTRRPVTRTPPRRCTGALSSGRRRHGRAKFASCSTSCSPAAPVGGAAGPGAAGGSPRGRRRGRQPPGPRRRDGSARPRLARRATRSGCGDLSDAAGRAALVGPVAARGSSSGRSFPTGRHAGSAAAAARGRAVARGTATHADGAPNPCGVAAAQQPGACWACRGSASPGHGSRMAAASVSVARKRRHADRAGGDLW
jgi:hypothetical protein